MKKRLSTILAGTAIFAAVAVPSWAVGVIPEKTMDIYMDSIYRNDNAVVVDFSNAENMMVTSSDLSVVLPTVGENSIAISRELENEIFDMQIVLPSDNANISLLSDRAVYKEDGYTQAVQIADNDIHIVTSVLNETAQDKFAYEFDLPVGAYMAYADYGTDNSVLVYNEDGEAVYTLVPGVAKDATGKDVDFVWDLQGETLVYGVADNQEVSYPVNISVNAVAAYGISHYFDSYSYNADYGKDSAGNVVYGYKVSLEPNWSNLYAIGTPAGFSSHKAASWSAVYNYYYNDRNENGVIWWKNDACMKSQYECHYNGCTANGVPNGDNVDRCETWDLETWRTGTAIALPTWLGGNGCNPIPEAN